MNTDNHSASTAELPVVRPASRRMPRLIASVLCLLSFSLWLPAQVSTEADYAALEGKAPTGLPGEIGWEKYLQQQDGHRQALLSAALAFHAAHPTDPRGWQLLLERLNYPPYFIKGFRPDVATKGAEAIIRDEPAAAVWRQQGDAFIQKLLASTDAPPKLRERAEWYRFTTDYRAASAAQAKGTPVDYDGFGARFDAHVAKHAGMDVLLYRATEYVSITESGLPGAGLGIWRRLLESPSDAVRDKAAERVKFLELTGRPLELTFTAADGRVVDLKALRGKVVLIDFWATWCEPCKEEVPNVVANYKKYHDRGFEVVGISLENAQLSPKDTPTQTDAKLAKAKKVLLDFTAAHDMPWPQYFDGRLKQNEIGLKYSVESIPTMFLLDQDGKLVTTNARGEKLEAEVKRLLRL